MGFLKKKRNDCNGDPDMTAGAEVHHGRKQCGSWLAATPFNLRRPASYRAVNQFWRDDAQCWSSRFKSARGLCGLLAAAMTFDVHRFLDGQTAPLVARRLHFKVIKQAVQDLFALYVVRNRRPLPGRRGTSIACRFGTLRAGVGQVCATGFA
ncbi:hypothetical protein LXT12_26530 [Pelomonas sp. P7]|uniref:Transposase DDE domain group 1 n=1 Tax=Pelomonas caseinilytica TaxID=2906763 RepID=A0ABS8XIX1_9BURK|nr:hypothetical protein [Pelomonas sp. P7]MCE4540791.1 hypothetical protein [Pelomonas sp. P7]